MTRPRRAQPRPARTLVPILIGAVVVLAVVAVAWRVQTDASATPETAASPVSASQARPPSAESSPSALDAAGPSSAGARTTTTAAEALDSCRDKVEAGQDVLAAAAIGIGHWSEHVQAQTDRFDGEISAKKMSAIFARTRVAGPDDISRYDDANQAWDEVDGTCGERDDASTADNEQLESCSQRLRALKPVLTAAADGMGDWKQHLADMRHSRMNHVTDAEQVWLDAWKAAPPHIEAFDQAEKTYEDAPAC